MAKVANESDDAEHAQYISSNYLVQTKSDKFRGRPKLIPTLQDRRALWAILKGNLPFVPWLFDFDSEEAKPNPQDAITPQWKRINKYLASSVIDAEGIYDNDGFAKLLSIVEGSLRFIAITLDHADDANSIFSRLNAGGIPLGLSDLIRNEVFSKFGGDKSVAAEKFYHDVWHPFELSLGKHLDLFFPIFSQIIFQGKSTHATAFQSLQARWKTHTASAVFKDIAKYSEFFLSLISKESLASLVIPKPLKVQVERISRMPRTTVTWPFIIEVIRAADRGIFESEIGEKKPITC